MTAEAQKETLGFQAEVTQLLDLMIHSLYSNKEIFLRELVSNASDAEDKLRFEALSDSELYESDSDLKIRVSFDKDARTITIADNGIGMSREEVINNIGTIAKSGTREFFQALTGDQRKDANLIGQFGVGFYSSFIVADKVTMLTRRAGLGAEHGVKWESNGKGDYTLENVELTRRGTEVILHLREDEDDLLNTHTLRNIITKYSDHITLPIVMPKEVAEGEETQDETVNKASALWTRSKSEITAEEYNEFYKHVSHDWTDPLGWVHARMEGKQEYTMLLYVPSQPPFDMWNRDAKHGVKLYVRRIFIMDDAEKLMPTYLRFVKGVIDSNDLPLNVSREILQQNKLVDNIRAGSVKKVLGLLDDMADREKDKYATFWKAFGKVLKEGVPEDTANRETIARLLRFTSTTSTSDTQDVSLDDYIGRMKEGQDKIYYLTADSYATAKNSPLLEVFRQKGVEVLLLTDLVDNWVVTSLTEYKDKQIQSIAKGELELDKMEDEETKAAQEKAVTDFKELTERLKATLTERVQDVRVTHRLTSSPSCVVGDENDLDESFKRILKASGQSLPDSKPILEINPTHPIIERLKGVQDEARFKDWSLILLEQAILTDGGELEDPVAFVSRLNGLLVDLSSK